MDYKPFPLPNRDHLFGDELIRLTAAFIANPTDEQAVADYNAALINRCASMAAAAVVGLYERVAQLEAQHGRD